MLRGMDAIAHIRSSAHPLDRAAAARDLWPATTLDFLQGRAPDGPDLVLWPADVGEVEAILRWATEGERTVVPYGAGSGVCGGARGRPGAVVIDLKAFDGIGPLDLERRLVWVEAGVNGQHLEDWLAKRGYTVGHSPSSIGCSTVGGWAAARGAGQFSSRYGVIEDMVLGLEAVAPGRGRFSVGEGGDAPDAWLPQLLGSEGTLAVITRVALQVYPLPETRWLRGYRFPSLEAATRAMRRLMQGELHPAVVRLYDPVDTFVGGKTRPKDDPAREARGAWARRWAAKVAELPGVRGRALTVPLALPGLLSRLIDRWTSGCLLIVGWEGAKPVVDALVEAGRPILEQEGDDLGAEPGERWFASRHAVSYNMMPVVAQGGFADTMEVAIPWTGLLPLYEAVRAAVRPYAMCMAHMSHVYPEGGSIYFSFAGRGDRATYDACWRAAQEAVLACGGTVTHHHGVGQLKAPWASAEVGPAIAGWRALKRELDPAGVLNPGRLFLEVEHREPAPSPLPHPDDALAELPLATPPARLAGSTEALWPWEAWPAPPRWQRDAWQVGWVGMEGRVGERGCRLGRGPRSAAGPDLRGWLAREGAQVRVRVPVAHAGPRWMGEARCERPWEVARALLLADLRPAVLTVIEGRLRVGFRGPAARALGAVAGGLVPGGLSEAPYRPHPLPSGALEACEADDPGVVAATLSGWLRRRA